MTLDLEEILQIINDRPNKALIDAAMRQYQKLYMHYSGEGVENYIDYLDEFMRENTKPTLERLIKGNRDMIHRVMNPRNKIYTAKGGMQHVNIPEAAKTDFSIFLSRIAEGMPIDEWIRQRLQPMYDYCPNGIIQIEVNAENEPYPRVRCIDEIYDYMPNGRALEYVIFEVSAQERQEYAAAGLLPNKLPVRAKVYRVIDDAQDRIVYIGVKQGQPLYSIQNMQVSSEIENEFGFVPCQIISDICGSEKPYKMDSPLSVAINLLDDIMTDGGLFKWCYWRQAFPKEWMQKVECSTCGGRKEIDGVGCPECHGTGVTPYMRTSDVFIVKQNIEKTIPIPPMGHIESDIAALAFMKDNGYSLEDYFSYTIWGIQNISRSTLVQNAFNRGEVSNTAYEARLNNQPKEDRQALFGKWRVSVMRFIIEMCAWWKYREKFKGCAIIQGDRFMNESSDATWDRYTKAVSAKAPMHILDTLLQEYNENKFNGNPESYRRSMLLMQVEPFVHEDVGVIWLDQSLPMIERLMKKYFDEWTSTITDYDIASVPEEGGADILREQLREYVVGRYVAGKKQDAILIGTYGEALAIGKQVNVIGGRELQPEHTGAQFTVASISGNDVTIKGGGMDEVFDYKKE